MVLAFLASTAVPALGRWLPPILAALVAGVLVVLFAGRLEAGSASGPWLAAPVLQAPAFTWSAAIELVVLLAITVPVVQNGQGMAVLRSAGHRPPMNVVTVACGLVSLPAAAVGAISTCLTGPTNALLTASGERSRHYAAAVWCGTLAMLRALQGAFCTAFSGSCATAALATFLVTVADVTLLNISAAFWGLVVGVVVALLVERADLRRPSGS